MKQLCLLIIILFIGLQVEAKHLYLEKDYQASWCSSHCGQMEYVLDDGARVDCLTKTHAVEFDFAAKWAESIGQALYYGLKTGKKPGIVLILENPAREQRYVKRLKRVTDAVGIDYWLMYPGDL